MMIVARCVYICRSVYVCFFWLLNRCVCVFYVCIVEGEREIRGVVPFRVI